MIPTPTNEPKLLPPPADVHEVASEPAIFSRADILEYNETVRQRVAKYGNLRAQVAFFRCPWPCSRRQYERIRKDSIDKWLRRMEIDGWQLASIVKDYPAKRRTAVNMVSRWYQVPVLDEVSIPVAAAFRKLNMKITREPVPVTDE